MFKVWVTMPFWLYPRSPSAPAVHIAHSKFKLRDLRSAKKTLLRATLLCAEQQVTGRHGPHVLLLFSPIMGELKSSFPCWCSWALSATPRLRLLARDSLQVGRITEEKEKRVVRWTLACAYQAWGKPLLSPSKSSGPSVAISQRHRHWLWGTHQLWEYLDSSKHSHMPDCTYVLC